MRAFLMIALMFAAACLWSADAAAATIPRPSPDFAVKMTDGKQVHVSDYRGKVLLLAFILTTCPHCQKTTQILDGLYPELAPKGFAVLEAVVNDNPDVASFVAQFKVPFPVGTAGVLPAVDYIQWPHTKVPQVPFLVFIDRQGTIRAQYTGVDEAFFDNQQEQHIRDEVAKLLNGPKPRK